HSRNMFMKNKFRIFLDLIQKKFADRFFVFLLQRRNAFAIQKNFKSHTGQPRRRRNSFFKRKALSHQWTDFMDVVERSFIFFCKFEEFPMLLSIEFVDFSDPHNRKRSRSTDSALDLLSRGPVNDLVVVFFWNLRVYIDRRFDSRDRNIQPGCNFMNRKTVVSQNTKHSPVF